MEEKIALGVDIAKLKFDVAFLKNNKFKTKVFSNTQKGFDELLTWLEKQQVSCCAVCLESTGIYGNALANYLHEKGFTVSIENPSRIKGFAISQMSRSKNDKLDAKLIAQFCQLMQPRAWQPEPRPIQELKALVSRLDALLDLEQQEKNHLEHADKSIVPSIESILKNLQAEIKAIKQKIKNHIDTHKDLQEKRDLLLSIDGVGEATVNLILAYMPDVSKFKNAKQMAAFAGLNPKERQSGSSVKGKTHLSKIGNSRLRKGLYFPAIVAKNHNPLIKQFSENLKRSGKSTMCIIGAVMRKLLHIIYGVLKSGKPFDPNFLVKNA